MERTLTTEQKELAEGSIVRYNLLSVPNYLPYCGDAHCPRGLLRAPYSKELGQFKCACGWVSSYPPEFIEEYKKVWAKS